jgi:hypothetical protein
MRSGGLEDSPKAFGSMKAEVRRFETRCLLSGDGTGPVASIFSKDAGKHSAGYLSLLTCRPDVLHEDDSGQEMAAAEKGRQQPNFVLRRKATK